MRTLISGPSMRVENEVTSYKTIVTLLREVNTCTVAFDGLTLFVDFAVVDVGSSPTTSTAAWTLAMLAVVVRCPDSTTNS